MCGLNIAADIGTFPHARKRGYGRLILSEAVSLYIIFKMYLYVYFVCMKCFAYKYGSALHVCLVPMEAKREWNWN